MFRGNQLVLDAPANLLEALVLGWTLVFCNLKALRIGRHVIIGKAN